MISIQIRLEPDKWKSIEHFLKTYAANIRGAMFEALAVLQGQIKLNLSGPSHTNFPGNGNPFPGVVSGVMRNTVNVKVRSRGDLIVGFVGPRVKYAIFHITGTRFMEKRDFLTPAYEKKRKKIQRIFNGAVRNALKG